MTTRRNSEIDTLQSSLAVARGRYEDLFEFAPVAYLVTDSQGLVVEANRAAAELLGVPQPSLLGEPVELFVEDRRGFSRRLAELNRSLEPERWELVIVPRRGERVHVEVAVRRALDTGVANGELRWMLRSVERRWEAEKQLRGVPAELEQRVAARTRELEEEGARLEAIIEQIPAGLVIADASTDRLILANSRAAALLQSVAPRDDREYSLGAVFRLDGTAYEIEDRPLVRSMRTGEVVHGEIVEVELADGERRLLELNAGPVRTPEGDIAAGVLVFQDVTERERRERAQRDFVTNAAHELQTPLAAITSAVEVLQAGAKESPIERDLFLDHAARECDRLRRLGRALLVLARAQIGAEPPRADLVEIRPLLEDVAASLTRDESRIEISCADDVAALADRDLLEQAVASLGANALKHADEAYVRLSARFENGGVTVEVSDGGPGIPADEQALVFERFYRGRRSAADGFGLGLAIVAQAARALQAELELDSNDGGTRIALRLPSARLLR